MPDWPSRSYTSGWIIRLSYEAMTKDTRTLEIEFEKSKAGDAFRALLLEVPEEIQKDVKNRMLVFMDQNHKKWRKKMREAVANYMSSEGCGCCSNREAHKRHAARLAKLLSVPKYDDGSGYDFYIFKKPLSN